MTYNEYDGTLHQHTEDACVEHNPHCAAFMGSDGLCDACWLEEHAAHTSAFPDESCVHCKPLMAALDLAEERLGKVSRIIASGILRTGSSHYLAQQSVLATANLWPESYSMLVRLNTDGIALSVARCALIGEF